MWRNIGHKSPFIHHQCSPEHRETPPITPAATFDPQRGDYDDAAVGTGAVTGAAPDSWVSREHVGTADLG